MVVFKENAMSDVMASGSVRTAPEPTVRLSIFALNNVLPEYQHKCKKQKIMASFEIRFFTAAVVKLVNTT